VADGESGTRDLWTVAYTPQTAVSVWMGYDAPDDEHRLPASLGGSGYPARLCAAFLGGANLPGTDFDRPDGVRTALSDDSQNAFLVIECVDENRVDDLRAAVDEFAQLMERYLGATIEAKEIITRENPEMVIVA
jgi:membrane peptidoglycan carboxypeptidase